MIVPYVLSSFAIYFRLSEHFLPNDAAFRYVRLGALRQKGKIAELSLGYVVDLKAVCKQMGRFPDWIPDILLRTDEYETQFYKKD